MSEEKPSFLSKAGSAAVSIAKHVPTRGALWGFLGLVYGAACIGLSFVIGLMVMERGALLLGYLLAIPGVIFLLGGILFFVHGLHRGAARAALEIEKKFGLSRYVVERVTGLLDKKWGHVVTNLPLAQFETGVKEAVDRYIGSDDLKEGTGVAAWVIRRGKRFIAKRLDPYLLRAYRAEEQGDGTGGGISLQKIGDRVAAEVSGKLGKTVMSALNKQLLLFAVGYAVLAVGWWYWLFLLMKLLPDKS